MTPSNVAARKAFQEVVQLVKFSKIEDAMHHKTFMHIQPGQQLSRVPIATSPREDDDNNTEEDDDNTTMLTQSETELDIKTKDVLEKERRFNASETVWVGEYLLSSGLFPDTRSAS